MTTYKRIQAICIALVNTYRNAGLFPYADGFCTDCGSTLFMRHDHRSYDDPFDVEVVCNACNARRGHASMSMLDVETLERHPILPAYYHRPTGKKKPVRNPRVETFRKLVGYFGRAA